MNDDSQQCSPGSPPGPYSAGVVTAGPSPGSCLALLAGAGVLVLLGLAGDAGGRVLAWPAAALLAAAALRDLALRPTLRADRAGVEIVTALRRRWTPWQQVEGMRVVTDRRTPVLEVDVGATLLVLSRRRLGRAPASVLEELLELQR